jgi:hypothetical protein
MDYEIGSEAINEVQSFLLVTTVCEIMLQASVYLSRCR